MTPRSKVQNDLVIEAIDEIASAIRLVTGVEKAVLHEPMIGQVETDAVSQCIAGGFVSSVGPAITQFENMLCDYTGAEHAVAVVNGTAALHLMLVASDIRSNSEVLLPALTFVASGNAILQANAMPHFVDSSPADLGIDVAKLDRYLADITEMRDGCCWNVKTGRIISHVMHVHVFGHIGNVEGLKALAERYNIKIVEDSAEALGSWKGSRHAGLFGTCGAVSFNGNKIVTTGGGGAILTDDANLATRIRALATTAKRDHPFLYWHEALGFNYRMPALNAAFGIAQMARLEEMLEAKSRLQMAYQDAYSTARYMAFFDGPDDCQANHWLNAIQLDQSLSQHRDAILHGLSERGYGCRPVWNLLSELPHLRDCPSMSLDQATDLANRLINIPSSAMLASSSTA
jgi:perosamine synthetase